MTKTAKVFCHLTNKTGEVDVFKKTGLSVGTRVTYTAEKWQAKSHWCHFDGEVLDVDFQGENAMGGQIYTAKVRWDNGEIAECVTFFLKKI